jgi:hypothetical protein
MRGRTVAGVGLALTLPLLGGCPIVEDLLGLREPKAAEETLLPAGDPVVRTEAKLAAYIDCRDSLEGPVTQSFARYTEHVGPDGRPRRRGRAFIYPVGKASFRACETVLAEAPENPPAMPEIERSAVELVDAARQYAELSRRLAAHFESRAFERDDGAELARLHPQLSAAHERWARADAVLELYLDGEKAANDPRLLEQLARDGEDLEYHTRALMVAARPLARCFSRTDSTPEECRARLAEFEAAHDRFRSAHEADPEGPEHVFWMSTFATDAQEFRERAAAHARRPQPDAEDRDDVVRLYRNLVRDAATLDFDFP